MRGWLMSVRGLFPRRRVGSLLQVAGLLSACAASFALSVVFGFLVTGVSFVLLGVALETGES